MAVIVNVPVNVGAPLRFVATSLRIVAKRIVLEPPVPVSVPVNSKNNGAEILKFQNYAVSLQDKNEVIKEWQEIIIRQIHSSNGR